MKAFVLLLTLAVACPLQRRGTALSSFCRGWDFFGASDDTADARDSLADGPLVASQANSRRSPASQDPSTTQDMSRKYMFANWRNLVRLEWFHFILRAKVGSDLRFLRPSLWVVELNPVPDREIVIPKRRSTDAEINGQADILEAQPLCISIYMFHGKDEARKQTIHKLNCDGKGSRQSQSVLPPAGLEAASAAELTLPDGAPLQALSLQSLASDEEIKQGGANIDLSLKTAFLAFVRYTHAPQRKATNRRLQGRIARISFSQLKKGAIVWVFWPIEQRSDSQSNTAPLLPPFEYNTATQEVRPLVGRSD